MKIVSSEQIEFLVSNIFKKYYEPVHTELNRSGLAEEIVYKTKQDILTKIYRSAMDEGVETEEAFDKMAVSIINDHLERVLVPYYARKYIEKYSLEQIALDNEMLLGIRENAEVQEPEKAMPETETLEPEETEPETEPVVLAEEITVAEEITITEENSVAEEIPAEEEQEEELPVIEDVLELLKEQTPPPMVRRMEEPRIRRFRMNWLLAVAVSLLVSAAIWFVVGILMGDGYIPRIDLGYTWFNSHIWRVF